jgi:hypothetical protein
MIKLGPLKRWIARRQVPLQSMLARLRGRTTVHFLHIGKTGGTAVKYALRQHGHASPYLIHLHGHQIRLCDIPKGDPVVFILRDPAGRYISSFNSRLREGKPRYYSPWRPAEKVAFQQFTTPNALALALSSPDATLRAQAEFAMRHIEHVKAFASDWLGTPDDLKARQQDLMLIGFNDRLAEDFALLVKRLGLPAETVLPSDDLHAHRSPSDLDRHLDDEALANLRRWYAKDYELLAFCRQLSEAKRN